MDRGGTFHRRRSASTSKALRPCGKARSRKVIKAEGRCPSRRRDSRDKAVPHDPAQGSYSKPLIACNRPAAVVMARSAAGGHRRAGSRSGCAVVGFRFDRQQIAREDDAEAALFEFGMGPGLTRRSESWSWSANAIWLLLAQRAHQERRGGLQEECAGGRSRNGECSDCPHGSEGGAA